MHKCIAPRAAIARLFSSAAAADRSVSVRSFQTCEIVAPCSYLDFRVLLAHGISIKASHVPIPIRFGLLCCDEALRRPQVGDMPTH
jgi:hypothetical protein